MVSKNVNNLMQIQRSIAGQNSYLSPSSNFKRFVVKQSFNRLVSLPVIHTNQIDFISMPQFRHVQHDILKEPAGGCSKECYIDLLSREEHGLFTLFTSNNELLCWKKLSGHQVSVNKSSFDIKGYVPTDDPI